MEFGERSKLAFVFQTHDTSLELANIITQEMQIQMQEVFVPGQVNIYFLEYADKTGIPPKEPVYPESAVDFDFNISAREAHAASVLKRGTKEAGLVEEFEYSIREVVRGGGNTQHLHAISALRAVDELNDRGYNVGLLYEEGIKVSTRSEGFLNGTLQLGLPAYKRMSREVHELQGIRDRKMVEQVIKLLRFSGSMPVNIFIPIGLIHGGMIELIPDEYRDSITFAVTDISNKLGDTDMNKLDRIFNTNREPTEEEWLKAYSQYIQLPKEK